MKIKNINIQNFRSIDNLSIECNDLNIFIGNNGTGKTTIIEAINYAVSPNYLYGRVNHKDFYFGSDSPIIIDVTFDKIFQANLQDGYTTQSIDCIGVYLEIKKRQKASPGKAFSDLLVVDHYVKPLSPKTSPEGWEINRKSGKKFRFTQRSLSFNQVELMGFPKCFYFKNDRERQLQKGYSSSLSSVLDDYNWRFLKTLHQEELIIESESFYIKKKEFENEILNRIDKVAFEKCFESLNAKLISFGINTVDLSFIDVHAPFENAYISSVLEKLNLPVSHLGSGIEMVIAILFLETLASLSKENIIVLIDEPELHLHPVLQEKLSNYLYSFTQTNQVFVSTHSPYFFKCLINQPRVELLITTYSDQGVKTENTSSKFGLFPWSPSWGEINYFAYDLPTVEFHNELFGYIFSISDTSSLEEFDDYITSEIPSILSKTYHHENGKVFDCSLCTYVRHKMHHPENIYNMNFTDGELKSSIKYLLMLLNKIKYEDIPF